MNLGSHACPTRRYLQRRLPTRHWPLPAERFATMPDRMESLDIERPFRAHMAEKGKIGAFSRLRTCPDTFRQMSFRALLLGYPLEGRNRRCASWSRRVRNPSEIAERWTRSLRR